MAGIGYPPYPTFIPFPPCIPFMGIFCTFDGAFMEPFHGEVGDSKTGDDPLEVQLYGVISTTEAGELAKCTREARPVLLAAACCTGVLGWEDPWERLSDVGDMTGERTTSPSRPVAGCFSGCFRRKSRHGAAWP